MQWVRRNKRFGSWAALFALTIQLMLSFAHLHPEGIQGSSVAIAAPLQAQASGGSGGTPSGDGHGSGGHDFCAICVALTLTSNSVLPTVSLLAIPVDRPHEWFADFRTAQVSFGLHSNFQARAPPRSI